MASKRSVGMPRDPHSQNPEVGKALQGRRIQTVPDSHIGWALQTSLSIIFQSLPDFSMRKFLT